MFQLSPGSIGRREGGEEGDEEQRRGGGAREREVYAVDEQGFESPGTNMSCT